MNKQAAALRADLFSNRSGEALWTAWATQCNHEPSHRLRTVDLATMAPKDHVDEFLQLPAGLSQFLASYDKEGPDSLTREERDQAALFLETHYQIPDGYYVEVFWTPQSRAWEALLLRED